MIGMHDLIQELGWEVIRQESRNELAERSRLWIAQDVFHVLENNKGTKNIEGIFLDVSKIYEDLFLKPAVFEAMSQLRLLKIYCSHHKTGKKYEIHLPQGLRYLPNSVRYLNWWSYPLKTLPIKFRPESLVELEMPFSQLKQLWDGVQPLGNLKRIDFSFSEQLAKIPDLSHASRLERIDLEGCTSLIEVPPLNFQNFDMLGSMEDDEEFYDVRAVGCLNLSRCTSLKILSEISGNFRILYLWECGIKELHSSIRSSVNLRYLYLGGCVNLKIFPELPRYIQILDLSQTPIQEIPTTSIECLHAVKEITMLKCTMLESLPSNFCKLKALRYLVLSGCSNLKTFPEILESMESLETLDLTETGIQELPSSFANMIGLRKLFMSQCKNLKTAQKCLSELSPLKRLFFQGCSKLESFPDMLFGLSSLEEVDLSFCNISEIPDWIGSLSSLAKLNLKGNIFSSIPPSIKQLSQLSKLDISHCRNLRSLPELPSSINHLGVVGCMPRKMVSGVNFRAKTHYGTE